MNWPTSLVQTRLTIRMIRPRSQFELVSFIEWSQRNVSFWWMSIVSGHFDDHSLFLSLMTDSLSGIEFTIVLLDLMVEIVGLITESNDDNCFFWSPRFRGVDLPLNGWVNENCFLFMTPCSGCFDEWFWMMILIRFPCLLAMYWCIVEVRVFDSENRLRFN